MSLLLLLLQQQQRMHLRRPVVPVLEFAPQFKKKV